MIKPKYWIFDFKHSSNSVICFCHVTVSWMVIWRKKRKLLRWNHNFLFLSSRFHWRHLREVPEMTAALWQGMFICGWRKCISLHVTGARERSFDVTVLRNQCKNPIHVSIPLSSALYLRFSVLTIREFRHSNVLWISCLTTSHAQKP